VLEGQVGVALLKEAEEVLATKERKKLIKEIVDLYEVVGALLAVYGINQEEVLAVQAQRRNERGAFECRLELLWVEEGD
jgi:predicted house-cleaning noncanonical NTP pyrophosphatase (MazG superfamily)